MACQLCTVVSLYLVSAVLSSLANSQEPCCTNRHMLYGDSRVDSCVESPVMKPLLLVKDRNIVLDSFRKAMTAILVAANLLRWPAQCHSQ